MNDSRYRNTSAINYLSLSQRSAAVVEIGLNSFTGCASVTDGHIYRPRYASICRNRRLKEEESGKGKTEGGNGREESRG